MVSSTCTARINAASVVIGSGKRVVNLPLSPRQPVRWCATFGSALIQTENQQVTFVRQQFGADEDENVVGSGEFRQLFRPGVAFMDSDAEGVEPYVFGPLQ